MDIRAINQAIAPKREDLVDEAIHVLGGGYMAADISIPHPVAGVVTLMDILALPWIDGREPTLDDIRAAVVLLEMREDAVGLVMESTEAELPIKHLAGCCIHEFSDDETKLIGASISMSMSLAATGFNFFPKSSEPEANDLMFGSEFLASICRVMGEMGLQPEQAIWREPLARVGFVMAEYARANGAKNVGRENTLDWSKAWSK